MADTIEKELRTWFKNAIKVVLVGIGNPIRADDYAGLKIVEELKDKTSSSICLIEAETVPESYLLDIEQFNPSHVLLIDSAVLGLKPGKTRLLDANTIENYSATSSHLLPLNIFCEYIKQTTGAKTGLLLIEPKSIEFGEELSQEVAETADNLANVLLNLLESLK